MNVTDPSTWRLRPAAEVDAAAVAAGVAAVWNPVIRDTLFTFNSIEKSTDEIASMIRDCARQGRPFILAEDADGEIRGFATYAQFRGGIGYARTMEHTIMLAPSARGRGCGRRLMASLEDAAARAGVHSLIGGISAENPAAIAFHKALGFAPVARLPEVGYKRGRWLDLVLMQKFVTAPDSVPSAR